MVYYVADRIIKVLPEGQAKQPLMILDLTFLPKSVGFPDSSRNPQTLSKGEDRTVVKPWNCI